MTTSVPPGDLEGPDRLLVVQERPGAAPEPFIMVDAAGRITGFNGHVDLGTGIATALAQIVAEELSVGIERVRIVLGDAARGPDQGPTIASETIQVTAVPLRQAAATARHVLLARAADRLGVARETLRVEDGLIRPAAPDNRALTYGELLRSVRLVVPIDDAAPLRPVATHRVVGQSVPRIDLPAKVTGGLAYVHDMRVPDMAHGRVVRPPYAGRDGGTFVGRSLIAVDQAPLADIPGLLAVVTIGDFVGVVAEREEHAALAAERLRVTWAPPPALPALDDIPAALRANPAAARVLLQRGDVAAATASAAHRLRRDYVWPYQLHASIGPSCALADWQSDGLTVWSGTQNPHALRADIATLMQLPEAQVTVIRMEAAGCYGRNCADDVAGDAALLSRAVRRPVRVQLTREQEQVWEPKGAGQLVEIDGGLDADGDVAAYDFAARYPSNGAPLLAALLTGAIDPAPLVFPMGDRSAVPPYGYETIRVVAHDMAPIVRAAWLRGVSALPNCFAHESWIDEAAFTAGVDPIAYRLRYLQDPRGAALVRDVAARASWTPRTRPGTEGGEGDVLRGRGFAYALYSHGPFPGRPAAWSAWVADVDVNRATGEVAVTRVTVGQDAGLMINPAGVEHQVHGNVIQSISRVLKEAVAFDADGVTTRDWGSYPILTFPEVPAIDLVLVPRPEAPPLGVGESATVPSAAAIANAIHDATGVRFREPPFTPERILAGLRAAEVAPRPAAPVAVRRGFWAALGAGVAGLVLTALPLRGAIPPVSPPDPTLYAAATIARGKALASLGACESCHTAPDGQPYAGGRGIATPFGTVYATNITPDVATGIGAWSFAAFLRAMREGIGRDGRHLYPAFPYTDFALATDDDLQAIYAYLMTLPPVRTAAARTRLAIPFSLRPLMAGWNLLFHRAGPFRPDPARSALWNRGAYLVEGLGHCGACHSPRNALGAERAATPLAGGMAEGWEAPALDGSAPAPVPWSEAELYTYLRTGFSRLHGPAAGPMAVVIRELAALPDADLRAMAHYLASRPAEPVTAAEEQRREATIAAADPYRASLGSGGRLYQGACAACHEPGGPPRFGVQPNLALNTNLQSALPDNVIRVVLRGIQAPADPALGAMPGFAAALDDRQVADLLGFLRRHFAPDRPPWPELERRIAALRAEIGGS